MKTTKQQLTKEELKRLVIASDKLASVRDEILSIIDDERLYDAICDNIEDTVAIINNTTREAK